MIRSQTEKIPPQSVTCRCVGVGAGWAAGHWEGESVRQPLARSRSVPQVILDLILAVRRQSEFPTGSPVVARQSTSVIGGVII